MSYRIDPDRPIGRNVRRIARRQLDGALAALAEPDDLGLEGTVHDVRKRCKKVRGLIRLVRPGLGDEYRRANAEARDAARELSAPDDDVAIVLSGLTENHRRDRRTFRSVLHDPTDEALHEWRKRAKYGWHHVTLLHAVAPSTLGPLGERLKDLSDALGDDHDLAVLRPPVVADLLEERAGV